MLRHNVGDILEHLQTEQVKAGTFLIIIPHALFQRAQVRIDVPAEAEAQKTSIAADAQAEANRKIAESLSDSLIEYQKIQKWDGRLPTVSGGNALVSIDPAE